jgi:hypothetical protein
MRRGADALQPLTGDPRSSVSKEVAVHGWMDGWDWVWMSLTMVLWIAAFGAVVYAAVRLAQRPPRKGS